MCFIMQTFLKYNVTYITNISDNHTDNNCPQKITHYQ